MATYYYQNNPILAPFTINSNQPVFDADTVSLKKIRTAQNAQRWELSFGILTNDNVTDTFLLKIAENSTVQTMVMPQFKEVDDATTISGTLTVQSTVAEGQSNLNAITTSASGLIPKGSFISFSNHDKVYILKTDLNADIIGADFEVYPSLRQVIPANTTIKYGSNCTLKYYPELSGTVGITYTDGILASPGTINIVEAL